MPMSPAKPAGLVAIEAEMVRQAADARASFDAARETAAAAAAAMKRTGKALLLGMGGSHAIGRAAEPLYRALGIEALATSLSEQLTAPFPVAGRTILVTSQSGESAEVVRWFAEAGVRTDCFGLTLEGGSFLARSVPSMVGAGGTEKAFAATRSLTISLAQHTAVAAALGADPTEPLAAMEAGDDGQDLSAALAALSTVSAVFTSGRRLRGLAEVIGLGFAELGRVPAAAMEGGQLRHGPMEMLSSAIGIIHFRGDDPTAPLIGALASATVAAGSPTVVFDASEEPPVSGAVTVKVAPSTGFTALFRLLPSPSACSSASRPPASRTSERPSA